VKGAWAGVWLAGVCANLFWGAPARAAEAFITDQSGDEVSVLDLKSKQVVARIPVLGKPAGIAMARDGRTAYVTSTEGKHVSVLDTESRNVIAKIAMPDTPLGIAADLAGRFLYVAGFYRPRLYEKLGAAPTLAAKGQRGEKHGAH
jgi:YVTN family beta-propeller protein